ncbi:MAG: peptidoglycan-binding domain-containing protein [bacterium]
MINKVISGSFLSVTLALGLFVLPASALASVGYGGGTTVTVATAPNPDGSKTGTVAGATTATETTPAGNVTVATPPSLQVTGPAGWTGDITLPTITTTTVAPVADSGNNASAVSSIVVGFGDSLLTFNKGVRLVFAGQAGNSIGYSHGAGTFHQITAVCSADSQTVGDALANGADCKINVSGDLVIWTKHFSTFTTYSQSTIPAPVSSGGGGGGGSGSYLSGAHATGYQTTTPATVATAVTIPTTTVRPQVLSAAAYNFTKLLQVGSTGADVSALQKFLLTAGFSIPAGTTGTFGAQTRAAVMAFQKAHSLSQVGVVGPQTRGLLNQGTNPTAPETTTTTASTLTAAQVQAIVGLLQSFNADQSVVNNVKASLGAH